MAWQDFWPTAEAPCPPLPVITRNWSSGDDLDRARAHFMCRFYAARGGQAKSTAEVNQVLQQAANWLYAEMGKHVVREMATDEGYRVIQEAILDQPVPVSGGALHTVTITQPDPRAGDPPPMIQPSQPLLATSSAGATAMPNQMVSPVVAGDFLGGLVGAITGGLGGLVTGGPIGAITGAIGGAYTGSGGSGSGGSPGSVGGSGYGTASLVSTTCPTGYTRNAAGVCTQSGIGGFIGSILPGDVGQPQTVWNPVAGRFGFGASPVLVQANRLACPAGMVLGKDNVCYERLAHSYRKWNPGMKPMITGGERRVLTRAKALQKKVKGVWVAAGKPGQARPQRHAAPARKR